MGSFLRLCFKMTFETPLKEGEIELLLRLAIGARSQLCSMAPSFKLLVLVDQVQSSIGSPKILSRVTAHPTQDQAFRQLDVPFLNRFEKQLVDPTELLDPARPGTEG